MEFLDRMSNNLDYIDPTEFDIGSTGWCINYISSTFLNGWINYVKPVRAFVIQRYEDDYYALSARVEQWHKEEHHHTQLNFFEDDVLLLARSDIGDWWYFWFDYDVSDCCIGKFKDDPNADIPAEFEKFVSERAGDLKNYHGGDAKFFNLDERKFRGWISF